MMGNKIRKVKIRKVIELEINRLQKEIQQYEDSISLGSKCRYYTLSGKLDVLNYLISS